MKESKFKTFYQKFFLFGLVPAVIVLISFLQLQASVSSIPFITVDMSLTALLWNALSLCLFFVLLAVLIHRLHIVMLLWAVLSFSLSFANYYVLLYHGAPITLHILKNTATALDVIGSYRFSLDKFSGAILFGFIVSLVLILVLWNAYKSNQIIFTHMRRFFLSLGCILLLAINIYFGIFSSFSFKPTNSIQFSWASSASEYGFLALQIESHFQEKTVFLAFDHVSEDAVQDVYNRIVQSKPQQPPLNDYPDIIFILNESFYDLNQVVQIQSNIDPLENFRKIDNATRGYVVAANEGGGTNRAEYELLTGFSTSLLPNQTPFLTLDLENHTSVVSHLEKLGYETYAAHCSKSANYNRNYGYPALGFDHSYFEQDFVDLEMYGNRRRTDESTYANLIKWYEQPSKNPKFMYLLTYQNHGGWEQNPEDLDTVFVKNDFDVYTSQVNEYLSSLQLSDIALEKLLSYFKTVKKPVIVCMLGDHCPSFAKNIADPSLSKQDLSYRIRSTPLLIWSNYGLPTKDVGYISLNYVVPVVLRLAGLPLSPFYQYQEELMKSAPVILSPNTFFDANMQLSPFDESLQTTRDVQLYFNMCYGHLKDNSFPNIFEPINLH